MTRSHKSKNFLVKPPANNSSGFFAGSVKKEARKWVDEDEFYENEDEFRKEQEYYDEGEYYDDEEAFVSEADLKGEIQIHFKREGIAIPLNLNGDIKVKEMKKRCLASHENLKDFEFVIESEFGGGDLKLHQNQDDLTLVQMLRVFNLPSLTLVVNNNRSKEKKKNKREEKKIELKNAFEQPKQANKKEELVFSLESMGFSTFRIQQEIINFEKGGKINPSLDDLLAVLLNEDPSTNQIESSRRIEPVSPSSLPPPPVGILASPSSMRRIHVSQPLISFDRPVPSAPLLHEEEDNTIHKKKEEEDDCMICFEKRRDCVIVPCGHLGFCFICADGVHKSSTPECPLCRTKINLVVKTYRV